MSQTLLTLPQQLYAPGTYGPFVTASLTPGATGYRVNYATDDSYPTGQTEAVLSYAVERSDDGGATWRPDAAVTLGGGPWYTDRTRSTQTTSGQIRVGFQRSAGSNTLLRATLTVYRACTIGGTLEDLP